MSTLNGLPSTIDLGDQIATLVAPRIDHASTLYRNVTSSSAVARYVSWRPHICEIETRHLLGCFRDANDVGRERHWVVVNAEAEAIGLVSCWLDKPHSVELGFCLAPQWWGQSIMCRAVKSLSEAHATIPQVYRLWATCDPENSRSARLLAKSGMCQEGVLARHAIRPNLSAEPRSSLLFGKAMR
jgi:ribosomal-protein-alanine N-acetyltransferase